MSHARSQFKQLRSVSLLFVLLFFFLTYIIVSGGSLHQYLYLLDLHSESLAFSTISYGLFPVMLFFTELVNPFIIIPIQICLLLVLHIVHRDRVGVLFTASLIIGELLALTIKYSIERTRPALFFTAVSRIGSSFPSNHALIATVFYGFIGYMLLSVYKKLWQQITITIITILLIISIGMSRVLLGVHWMSDVVGGWLIGGAILSALISSLAATDRWWKKMSHPHQKYVLFLILLFVVIISLLTSYYFVTNPVEVRSILYA